MQNKKKKKVSNIWWVLWCIYTKLFVRDEEVIMKGNFIVL